MHARPRGPLAARESDRLDRGSRRIGGRPAHRRGDAIQAPLKWWRFHQMAAALAYWTMVWPAWIVHGALGRGGLAFFFALLAAIVIAGNLRLHLWFSSRVYPEDLRVAAGRRLAVDPRRRHRVRRPADRWRHCPARDAAPGGRRS